MSTAGDLAHDLAGLQRAEVHVILDREVGHRLVRVLPGDDEDGEALLDQVPHHAVLRLHVEDVVLVDPVRDDQQRGLVHGLGRRRVLDQLDQPVAVDHLARRQGEVAARREGRQVDDAETAFLQVVQQVARPVGEAGPAGLHGPAQGGGIGHQQQRRAHGVDELAQVEVQALPLRLVHALDLALLQQPVRGQQVQLLEGAVDRVVVPFRRREPLVGRGRRRSLGLVGAGHAPPALARLVPGVDGGAPERQVQLRDRGHGLLGLSQRVQPDGAQRPRDLRPIDRHDLAQRIGVPHLVDGAQEWVLGEDVVELLHATGQHVAR